MSDPSPNLERYIGNREEFPVLQNWDFFNHAGVTPMPRAAANAMRKYAAESENGGYLETAWYPDVERLRLLAARMLNAHRDEIAMVKNTSEGISIVAGGVDWQKGDRIVTTNVEYPANVYPWMEVARLHGCELVMVSEESDAAGRRRVPAEKILREAAHPRTRMVTLSHVEFASGQRHDLAAIGAFCRANGKLFNVDAIQAIGVIAVDVQAMNIDYLSADGHKWMLGPEGAGIFYCRRELLTQTKPVLMGWKNVINSQAYGDYDYTMQSTAGRFECGTYNIPGILGLKAAMELLDTVGIAAVGDRIRLLTDRLIERLIHKGYHIISPRDAGQWSGIVSFVSPVHDHAAIVSTLRKEHRTEIAFREGRLRASPHFYNTVEQIDRLVEHLPAH